MSSRARLSKRSACATLVLLLVGGCSGGGFRPLNRPTLRASNPQTLVIARTESPKFTAAAEFTVVRALFPVAGVAADADARGAANDLRRQGRIEDPAVAMRAALAERLAQRFSLRLIPDDRVMRRSASVADLAASYPNADLILEISTNEWALRRSAGSYGIVYDGTLRLIDRRSGKIVAEGVCATHPGEVGSAPGHAEYFAGDAELLKQELASVTSYCVDDYRKRVLGLF